MTAFAARFSATQRAALDALGYAPLERRGPDPQSPSHPGAAIGRDPAPPNHGAPMPHVAPLPHPGAPEFSPPRSTAPANPPPSPTARALPQSVLVVGLAAGDALAEGIERALASCIAADDPRVRRSGTTLELATGGSARAWRVHLDQLRRSPRHKAALWRAMRALRGVAPR